VQAAPFVAELTALLPDPLDPLATNGLESEPPVAPVTERARPPLSPLPCWEMVADVESDLSPPPALNAYMKLAVVGSQLEPVHVSISEAKLKDIHLMFATIWVPETPEPSMSTACLVAS
jgi:hypothetical protein